MSCLVAATVVGAFSMSAIAATAPVSHVVSATPAASAIAERPADAPKEHASREDDTKKHLVKAEAKKTALTGAVFYAEVVKNVCHQRFRWPVTTPVVPSSRGGIRLISQPGRTEDFIALEPHELPR